MHAMLQNAGGSGAGGIGGEGPVFGRSGGGSPVER